MIPVRLAVITTSRSDFGLLDPVIRGALADRRFEVKVIVCGQHLVAHTPLPHETAAMPVVVLPSPVETVDHVSQRALSEFMRTWPADIALVMGDRFELLSVAESCTFAKVPIAHCSGGERTMGAFDDQIRDAITKLSHLHLVSHDMAARRVVSLQEEPWRVAITGEPGLDTLLREPRMTPAQMETILGVRPSKSDVVVALHPVTRSTEETRLWLEGIQAFCESFEGHVFLSAPNGDPGSDVIEAVWLRLSSNHLHCHALPSLGTAVFRGLVAACGALVGNSSAGVVEAPGLGTAILDLGSRQEGRIRADSVVNCRVDDACELPKKIRHLLSPQALAQAYGAENPYGDGRATQRILEHIWREIRNPRLMWKS